MLTLAQPVAVASTRRLVVSDYAVQTLRMHCLVVEALITIQSQHLAHTAARTGGIALSPAVSSRSLVDPLP